MKPSYEHDIEKIIYNDVEIPISNDKWATLDYVNSSAETTLNESKLYTDTKVADLDNNLKTLDEAVDSLGESLETINGTVNALDETLVAFGNELEGYRQELLAVDTKLDNKTGVIENNLSAVDNKVDVRVNTFHAAIDNSNFRYVKGSADFTYEQAVNTENCQIEVSVANEKVYLKKQEYKNINPPDSIAGRYVGFSELIRVAGEMAELFLFVYDPENLPTDPASLENLEGWGDVQYCVSSYQPVVMGNFLDTDVEAERNNNTNAPSTKAVGDYTDKQCGVVLDYMQTTFANNIMALVADKYGPHIIYNDPTGFEASNNDAGDTWHLTGLDLSPYKRIKCYVCCGGDADANYSPEHIVEIHLDDRGKGSFGYFTADHAGHCPNNRNRHHIVTFTVNAEKTAIQFQHSISIYGTAASDSIGGRRCYLIEGYKI